ncbi:hypothetical protein M3649_17865 [Ureibacillus chungkukjangi]|nr:hypothetical protein [Ureibacillus chungkukjangi]MCM3389988.1 hypothetical protein [Ureibacillus chungkukjangi]
MMTKRKYPLEAFPLSVKNYTNLKNRIRNVLTSLNCLSLEEEERLIFQQRGIMYPDSWLKEGISGQIWRWTQIYGKRQKKGIEYWSDKALVDYEERIKNGENIKNIYNEDHAVPRNKLISELLSFSKEDLTEEKLWDYFVSYNVGVHLLSEEHKNLLHKNDMPPSFNTTRNVWSRYEQENFNIVRITWQGKQIIHKEEMDKHDPSYRPSIIPYYNECKNIIKDL